VWSERLDHAPHAGHARILGQDHGACAPLAAGAACTPPLTCIVRHSPDEPPQAPTSSIQQRWQSSDDLIGMKNLPAQDVKQAQKTKRSGGCFGKRRTSPMDLPAASTFKSLVNIDIARENSKLLHHFWRNRDKIVNNAAAEVRPSLLTPRATIARVPNPTG